MRTNSHVYGERAFWLKGEEAALAKQRLLTVILREKDRSDPATAPKQWLPLFERVPVYFLDEVAAKGGPLGFEPDDGSTVQVLRRAVGRLGDIVDADLYFRNGGAVPTRADEVRQYFETEMAPGKMFGPETVVTIYWIEWLPNEEPALAVDADEEGKPDTTSGVSFDLGLYGDRTFPRS